MSLKSFAWLTFLHLSLHLSLVGAHGDHSGPAPGENIKAYAERHMASEHHIDSFDIRSFFHLHDLNRDGFWDKEEIEAVYGVHHIYSKQKSKDDIEHQKKAEHIVAAVLRGIDSNKDGKISPEELEAAGMDALPSFEHMGADGHHFDEESEFFLHHEEQFHSTPETQTDEAYNHPEDLEHFAQHQSIEYREAEKEAKFQGITVEEALKSHEQHAEPVVPPETGNQAPIAPKKINRVTPPEKQDPAVRFRDAKAEAEKKGEWGGAGGYQAPADAGDRMRRNVPYKFKFRRTFSDF
ncbi:hypothetical protein C8J56DRAFT_919698 [Mycena floridula]|nr:hypothetical protein C8J56DRAFT_919698 [Mycena floridula]